MSLLSGGRGSHAPGRGRQLLPRSTASTAPAQVQPAPATLPTSTTDGQNSRPSGRRARRTLGRFLCPFPACPLRSSSTFTGWASFASLASHLSTDHISRGELPSSDYLNSISRWICLKCHALVLTNSMCRICHTPEPQATPDPQTLHSSTSTSTPTPPPPPDTILSTFIKTVDHIPRPARSMWATAFSNALSSYLQDPSDTNLSILLILPKVTLYLPPRRATSTPLATVILSRLQRFAAGDFQGLWADAAATSPPTRPRDQPAEDLQRRLVLKAVGEGAISRASRLLSPQPPPLPPTESHAALAKLHPPRFSPTWQPMPAPSPPPFNAADLNPKVVRSLIRSFPPLTSPGPSGLRASHLQDLLSSTSWSQVCTSFTQWITLSSSCSLPLPHLTLFSAATLIPIPKKTGGVRPIAVGETLRRLTSKALQHLLSPSITATLLPLQKGINLPEACTHTVHVINT